MRPTLSSSSEQDEPQNDSSDDDEWDDDRCCYCAWGDAVMVNQDDCGTACGSSGRVGCRDCSCS